MEHRSPRHSLRVWCAATVVAIGTLAGLAPARATADAEGPLFTFTSHTNTDQDKKVFVKCHSGQATGGGAQILIPGLENLPPGQRGRVSITQVIPSKDLDGYAARAQAEAGFRFPWALKAYVICQ